MESGYMFVLWSPLDQCDVITLLYKIGDNNFYCIPSTTSFLNRRHQSSFNVEKLTIKSVKVILCKSKGIPPKIKGICKDFSSKSGKGLVNFQTLSHSRMPDTQVHCW